MPRIKRKAMVIVAGVLGLLGMSGALAAYFALVYLPPPHEASREQLVQWMATRDLESESFVVRAELIARLQSELDAGIDLAALDEQIDERSAVKLRQNLDVLLRQWFLELSGEYWQTDVSGRQALLDGELERLKRWRLTEYMATDATLASEARANPLQALAELSRRLESWANSAPADQQVAAHNFATVIQTRIAWQAVAAWGKDDAAQ